MFSFRPDLFFILLSTGYSKKWFFFPPEYWAVTIPTHSHLLGK